MIMFQRGAARRLAGRRCSTAPAAAQKPTKAPGPDPATLTDKFGRRHSYLRISLTERCNLRCHYCMPEQGVTLTPSEKLLTAKEIQRVASVFVKAGVNKIRLTGGEPLIRKDLPQIVESLGDLRADGLESISMTTNGIRLQASLVDLIYAGLNTVNVSLDTMDSLRFQLISKRMGHHLVIRGILAAVDAYEAGHLDSVKVNCVVMRNINADEILDFVGFARIHPVAIRFIEFMPFADNTFNKDKFVSYAEMLDIVRQKHPGLQRQPSGPNDTAKVYTIPEHVGHIGFISSMSEHFCDSCNRLRITADGNLKVCLFDKSEVSLRDALRGGCSDEELAALVSRTVKLKKARHAGLDTLDVIKGLNRPMITIGG
ncbi:GTP 3',8-cyclase [Plasmodiophora brassicae]|nr:hypothetical protein PBRA_004197 [Plasmodiophora brassicae]